MIRSLVCSATLLLLGSSLRAGELDAEFGPKSVGGGPALGTANAPAERTALVGPAGSDVGRGSELDAEGPVPSWRHFGGFGFGRGFGFGGFGYGPGFGYRRGFG